MRVRSFAAWVPIGAAPRADGRATAGDAFRTWRSGALTVRFAPRAPASAPGAPDELPVLVLGDDAEFVADAPDANMANGVAVRYDATARSIVVATSIVGLPPVYHYRGREVVAVASDLHLLSTLPGVRLEFDPAGVSELARFGHPVGHRTLFHDVTLLAAAGRFSFGVDGRSDFRRSWSLPEASPVSPADFIEAQVAAFTAALRRIDLGGSFISLTAGLDTRTVFSVLARESRLVPAVTMSGARRSLDARIAARLCGAYGIRHEVVTFDERFSKELPRLVEVSSRLSGGITGLGQAPEVFLYEQAGRGFGARLSGNLGNQVGRGGTEGVSVRSADVSVLSPRLRGDGAPGHWLLGKLDGDARSRMTFILEAEIAWSSVANFSVGDHFAAQQTPYADRALIETLAARPRATSPTPSGSMLHMRLRDLKHRFLGEPERVSFQRTLVHRMGGAASTIPINWGWLPAGGVSPVGLAMGVATLMGMAARAKGLDDGPLRRPLQWTGLPALHDFHETRRWLRVDLKEFVLATLGSQRVLDSDLFDRVRLDRVLEEHFGGVRDHYQTVTLALDLALAQRQFGLH